MNLTIAGIRKYPPISVHDGPVCCPLTFQQERVLYFCELNPNSSIWDINTCRRITGRFDAAVFERAAEKLIELHPVLRTRISRSPEGPVQTFDQDTRSALRQIDLSNEPDADTALRQAITDICQKPISAWTYDELLFELVLMALGPADHVLLFRVHHIMSDAASLDLLWRDLRLIYNDLFKGGTGQLPPKPMQYSDYAIWQRQTLTPGQTREQEQYWLSQFDDSPPALDLPSDNAPAPGLSFNGGLAIADVPSDLVNKFQRLSWERRVLLFSSLLSAFYVLLQKLCQQADVTVGVLFSGRHYCPALQNVTGFFVNMAAIRMDVQWDCTFAELVRRVHEQVEAAYYMQDYPFERLVEQLAPARGDGRVPLVRTMFNLVPNLDDNEMFAGVERECWIDVATQTNSVQVDLIFDLHWDAKHAEVRIEHNTDIFRTDTVVRFAGYYANLLRQLSSNWDIVLKDLDLVDAAEAQQLVHGWNHTAVSYPRDKCVHELFEQQARERPGQAAMAEGSFVLTYDEVNKRANRLARVLRELGAGPENIVAIVGTRSAEMVIGQLAILKAGSAYLPIAASSPAKRTAGILQDAAPRVLVLPDGYRENLEFSAPVVRLRDPRVTAAGDSNPVHETKPSNLANVIYTSGSTGAPKGVMIEHRSVVNLATNLGYLDMHAGDRILQTGSPSFDATTFEIWGALLNGLTLYFADDDVLMDAAALGAFLDIHRINILFLIPPLLNQLADANEALFRPLKTLVTGGDVVSVKHVERIRGANPGLTVVNAYGPTENTTFATCHRITDTPKRSYPIGLPVPNAKAYVLDRDMRLSPPGAVGELYVAGDSLARGYLNEPILTEERFLQNPFVPGERMYKTGDLVTRRADGPIEFVGRVDRQVKIRGFRIELGEIENALMEHREVREAAVIPVTAEDGSKFLSAYYVADITVTASDLRKHLAAIVPAYMVPSYFCRLDRMPLTGSGKIDTRAFPAPQSGADADPDSGVPATEEELAIAQIWGELLGTSHVGVNDNFFEIGGHSLKASVLAAKLTAQFGAPVSLRNVFDAPTIAELAVLVTTGGRKCHATVAR
jgi:amino acid adenylation domain-containing protein